MTKTASRSPGGCQLASVSGGSWRLGRRCPARARQSGRRDVCSSHPTFIGAIMNNTFEPDAEIEDGELSDEITDAIAGGKKKVSGGP